MIPKLIYPKLRATFWLMSAIAVVAACRAESSFQIVAAGKSRAAIVIASAATPSAYLAAHEVQNGVRQITGVTVPVTTEDKVPKGSPMILIGESRHTRALKIDISDFAHAEYLVSVGSDSIILIGKDSPISSGMEIDYGKVVGSGKSHMLKLPGMYDAQGSLKAAYYFLEYACGIRYYGPRSYLCHYPRLRNLSVNQLRVQREPFLKYTNGLSNDHHAAPYWPIQKILYDNAGNDEILLFARRLGTGGRKWHSNHTYDSLRYRERFGKKNTTRPSEIHQGYRKDFWPPEGSPSHQLCYSSEALAKQVAQDAADYFDGKLAGKPYGLPVQGLDIFPVVPYDAGNYCTCDRCQSLLKPYRARKQQGVFGDGTATDYVFNFANMVARHLKKTHPDKYVSVLAYEGYLWPPVNVRLESNIAVAPCLVTCTYWNRDQYMRDMEAFRYWQKRAAKTNTPFYLWNYYHQPEEIGMLRGHKVFPHFSAHLTHRLTRDYKKANVEGIFLCGWGEGLDFYAMMKGFDNPDLDLDRLLEEYFRLSFGPKSGVAMRQFYAAVEKISNDPKSYGGRINERVFWENQGNLKNLDRLTAMLKIAEKHLPGDLERKRLTPWKNLMAYMRAGRAEWIAKKSKLLKLPPHSSIAPGYIQPQAVYSGNADRHYRLVTGWHMIESQRGVFGTKDAKLNITTDADRGWEQHGGPDGVSVTLDLGGVYRVDEIRIWNFQQNRGWGLNVKGMKNVMIELSHETDELSSWKPLTKTIIPMANDRAAFPASAVIPGKSRKARYVRITAVGGMGIGNWAAPGHRAASYAGLGQVRVYGRKQ